MKIRIKTKPEDFIVEEIVDLPFVPSGKFAVYKLTKQKLNTLELLFKIAKELKIPFEHLSFGGRKDKYGLTTQYITIQDKPGLKISERNFTLEFVGCMDRPMGPDLILENKFHIVVRKINPAEAPAITEQIRQVEEYGFPNFFDDQRFGNFDARGGFIAEKILKKQYNGALKLYLTNVFLTDTKEEKERRQYFFEHWREWGLLSRKAKTTFEKSAFGFLQKDPKGFLPLLQRIPEVQMRLFFSAYQSFLWNEVIRRLLKERINELFSYKGVCGDYLFYPSLKQEEFEYLKSLNIPTPSSKLQLAEGIGKIYSKVLEDNGVKTSSFNLRSIRQAYFKSILRSVIVFPKELVFEIKDDDMHKDSIQLILDFSLARGCFATMLVKRLFAGLPTKNNKN